MTTTSAMSGCFCAVAHAHVDRQRLLERRLLVAAGAVALRPADHHQALAEVADVDLERGQLPVGQAQPRDVDEDDAVVAGEAGEVGRQRLGDDRVDLLALVLERRDQLGRDRVVAGQDERPRLALDDRVRVGAVVLAERVEGGLDDGPEACGSPASVGLTSERDRVRRRRRARPAASRPASPSANSRTVAGLGDRRADLGDDRRPPRRGARSTASSAARSRTSSTSPSPIRRVSIWTPRDAASAASAWPSPVVSLPSESRTIRFWASSGKSAVASRSAAPMSVADLTGVEASRSISVSSAGSRSTSAPLPNATMPATSPSGVPSRRLAQERERVLAPGVADRIGQVDDEDRRQPVDRQDQLEAGQGEDERRRAAASERRARRADGPSPSAAAPRGGARSSAAAPGSSRSSASGASKRDAHQALPSGGVPPEPGAETAPQPDQRVAVVDGPLDAQADEDEQHDRDPQLVAGGRAGRPAARRRSRVRATPARRRRPRGPRSAAAEPGAIVDSSTSKRSTAKRTGAFGSTGRRGDGAAGAAGASLTAACGRRRRAPRRRTRPTARRSEDAA